MWDSPTNVPVGAIGGGAVGRRRSVVDDDVNSSFGWSKSCTELSTWVDCFKWLDIQIDIITKQLLEYRLSNYIHGDMLPKLTPQYYLKNNREKTAPEHWPRLTNTSNPQPRVRRMNPSWLRSKVAVKHPNYYDTWNKQLTMLQYRYLTMLQLPIKI